jgi:hypothetical protein
VDGVEKDFFKKPEKDDSLSLKIPGDLVCLNVLITAR